MSPKRVFEYTFISFNDYIKVHTHNSPSVSGLGSPCAAPTGRLFRRRRGDSDGALPGSQLSGLRGVVPLQHRHATEPQHRATRRPFETRSRTRWIKVGRPVCPTGRPTRSLLYPRDPSTFSEGGTGVGARRVQVPSEVRYDWIPRVYA